MTTRAAWASLLMFVEFDDGRWESDPPDVDQAVETMFAVAARSVDETWLASWLRDRVRFPKST
jgi:prophage maintenance system killer protein